MYSHSHPWKCFNLSIFLNPQILRNKKWTLKLQSKKIRPRLSKSRSRLKFWMQTLSFDQTGCSLCSLPCITCMNWWNRREPSLISRKSNFWESREQTKSEDSDTFLSLLTKALCIKSCLKDVQIKNKVTKKISKPKNCDKYQDHFGN